MRIRVIKTSILEYNADPRNYQDGSSLEDMVRVDFETGFIDECIDDPGAFSEVVSYVYVDAMPADKTEHEYSGRNIIDN